MSFSCETDESGECSILDLKQGEYSLSIIASDYENYSEESININDNLQITREINLVITTWDKTYGGIGSEYAGSIVELNGGGFAVAGWTDSKGAGGADVWILGLDDAGDIVWEKTYGGSENDYAGSIVELSGGGFAVAGSDR